MPAPLIAIVGDINPNRPLAPAPKDTVNAKLAAEKIGMELARRGARLLVYGGPFLESDVVRGFVAGKPSADRSILMWYTQGNEPDAFAEEDKHARLFERRPEGGADWETAFYRSITRADGIVLIGGGTATKISGQVAIGSRMPIVVLEQFGGGAAQVWATLSAGEDLPSRDEIDAMAKPWRDTSAATCVDVLFAQIKRRALAIDAPNPMLAILAAAFFIIALSVIPAIWGMNRIEVWMLFLAPLLAGGSGATLRPMVDRLRGTPTISSTVLATTVLGLVAGGIAGVLFITAQLTGNPQLTSSATEIANYASRSIPFAVGVGFVAGLTSDGVFNKLLGLDVLKTTGIEEKTSRAGSRRA